MLFFLSKIFEKLMFARLDSYLKSIMYKSDWLPQKFKYFRLNYWIPWLCLFIVRQQAEHHCCISRFLKRPPGLRARCTISQKHPTQLIITYWWVSSCIMASEVSCSAGLSLIWVTINNMYQSETAVPLCQTLHLVFHKARCWAQYFFFCISMTCIDNCNSIGGGWMICHFSNI